MRGVATAVDVDGRLNTTDGSLSFAIAPAPVPVRASAILSRELGAVILRDGGAAVSLDGGRAAVERLLRAIVGDASSRWPRLAATWRAA